MITLKQTIVAGLAGLAGLSVGGCKPAGPPPDLVKTQREALDKAKTVEGQLLQQAEERKKAEEEGQK